MNRENFNPSNLHVDPPVRKRFMQANNVSGYLKPVDKGYIIEGLCYYGKGFKV